MQLLPSRLRLRSMSAIATLLFGLVGCATPPPASDPEAVAEFQQNNDPYEPANRVGYAINNGLDTILLRPAAQVYRYVVPGVVRRPISNVLANISSPVVFVNDVLQTRPRKAGDTFMRFLINTTVGVAGIFDVASDWGYPRHDNDFGITLAMWGVGEGPFLFLPVIGPSNPRDATGFGVDIAFDPFTYAAFPGSKTLGYSRYGLGAVSAREQVLDSVDAIKRDALDPYATFRSLARQHRASEIEAASPPDQLTTPSWYSSPR